MKACEYIQLDKASFDKVIELVGIKRPFYCDSCKSEITKNNFGLIRKDHNACKNILCVIEVMNKFDYEVEV
jgi:hypothetical protein